jgi:hypothetical protein
MMKFMSAKDFASGAAQLRAFAVPELLKSRCHFDRAGNYAHHWEMPSRSTDELFGQPHQSSALGITGQTIGNR